jgi:uncharacterized protein (DUF1800 family)
MVAARYRLAALFFLVVAQPVQAAPLSDIELLNRVTWGATESSLAKLHEMGTERWLEWQIHPTLDDVLPTAAQSQVDDMAISQLPMATLATNMQAEYRAVYQISDLAERQIALNTFGQAITGLVRQSAARDILRDLYSPTQLRERMTWFWFNHFNVQQGKADIRTMVADYQDRAIRPHALGKYRDLLMATLRHPAMLQYLDNATNAVGHINENYAREIMELHSMGVGSGYTQQDVQELARILTGVGVDFRPEDPKLKPEWQAQLIRDGLFEFNPARHDYGDKIFLGQTIHGSGFAEVEQAVDLLSRQPATALHISRQMAIYFMGDQPPEALVQRMAQKFTQSDGDIATVLGTMFRAPEFAAAPGKFKDPMQYVISAVRLAYGDRVILNTLPIQGWLNRMGQGIYNRDTPDGYSMLSTAWNGPGQLAVRFEIARAIGSNSAGLFKPATPGATDQPAFPTLQNALYFNATRHRLSPATKAALDQAISPQDWNTLFLSSPEFMY